MPLTSLVCVFVVVLHSISLSIAQILSHGKLHTRSGRATPVHEFDGMFRGESVSYRITSVAGHIYGCDFVPGHESWDADPSLLFSVQVEKKAEKGAICAHLRQEAQGMDVLVLWLDCDREGENICFEVLENTMPYMNAPRGAYAKQHQLPPNASATLPFPSLPSSILRAHFSSITSDDIHAALSSLRVPNYYESRAVDARQEIDLKIGVVFTRFQSKHFQNNYGNLESNLISFGPCQTPTLGFCVKRHDEIQTFIPEPYWVIHIKIPPSKQQHNSGTAIGSSSLTSLPNQQLLELEWDRGRIFHKEVALMFHKMLLACKTANIISLDTTEKKRPRPTPLNTVELLKVCSRQLGIGPADAMRVAEHVIIHCNTIQIDNSHIVIHLRIC